MSLSVNPKRLRLAPFIEKYFENLPETNIFKIKSAVPHKMPKRKPKTAHPERVVY